MSVHKVLIEDENMFIYSDEGTMSPPLDVFADKEGIPHVSYSFSDDAVAIYNPSGVTMTTDELVEDIYSYYDGDVPTDNSGNVIPYSID